VLEVPDSPDLTPGNERSCMCVLEVLASPDLTPGNEWSCMCVLEVSILILSTVFLLDFGNVPTMLHCFALLRTGKTVNIELKPTTRLYIIVLHNIYCLLYRQ
jgi:hypothetical protein